MTLGTDMPPWAGVVLAGGRSSRMGQDKASLPWRGGTLLTHARNTLLAAGAATVVVSGDYPGYAGVADTVPHLGPVGGVASVIHALPDGVMLFLPVDMPLLSAGLLRQLAASQTACASFREHILPMRLRVDADARHAIATLLERPAQDRSLRALHAALGGVRIALSPQQSAEFANCNTPEEWQAMAP